MLSHQKQHNAFCPDRTSTFIDYEQASQWFDLNIGGFSSQEFEADALQMRLLYRQWNLTERCRSIHFGYICKNRRRG